MTGSRDLMQAVDAIRNGRSAEAKLAAPIVRDDAVLEQRADDPVPADLAAWRVARVAWQGDLEAESWLDDSVSLGSEAVTPWPAGP
jgi:hypothetical protein